MNAAATTTYGASTTRSRRTIVEIETLDNAIILAVETEYPVSLRGVFYRVMSAGAIDKTELSYRTVGRRLLDLRRQGRVDYDKITDGTRWIYKPRSFDSWQQALVDAIPANELRRIVDNWITGFIDDHALEVARAAEDSERDALRRLALGGER